MKEAWLHRRALKGGLKPHIPLYLLTAEAFQAGIDAVYADIDAVKQYAPFPQDVFAVELPLQVDRWRTHWFPDGGHKRALLICCRNNAKEYMEVFAVCDDDRFDYGTVFCGAFCLTDSFDIMVLGTTREAEIRSWIEDDRCAKSIGAGGFDFLSNDDRSDFYKTVAQLGHDWLVAACAVIATPGLPREEGRSRAPEPKQRTRGAVAKPADFAWSRISLDIDRTVSGGEKAQEAEARKLASSMSV